MVSADFFLPDNINGDLHLVAYLVVRLYSTCFENGFGRLYHDILSTDQFLLKAEEYFVYVIQIVDAFSEKILDNNVPFAAVR